MSSDQVHFLFLPLLAQGHMRPILAIAKLLAARGAKSTIITTTQNASVFSTSGDEIELKIIAFPSRESGLPEGVETLDGAIATGPDGVVKFGAAMELLQDPVERLVRELRPHGLVADMFFPWSYDVASRNGIPRLIFHGTSFFCVCANDSIKTHQPHKRVASDSEPFLLDGLPDRIEFTRWKLPDNLRLGVEDGFSELMNRIDESNIKSYGTIFNSFYELEPGYVDHYRNVLGRKAWHIGPVSFWNRKIETADEHGSLKWLDSMKPESVVYVCFGSLTIFSDTQLREIAAGLEASEQPFIWVVRRDKTENENWLPEGFEERTEGKGLIIRGWANQVAILDHAAVGGFVTHCGWNSTLEGVAAGLPMVTWPLAADQFHNEKLITEVLRIGVGVGASKWVSFVGDFVKSGELERAVREIMAGERSEEMRNKAKELGAMARRAVEDGGSSDSDLCALIQDTRKYHAQDHASAKC